MNSPLWGIVNANEVLLSMATVAFRTWVVSEAKVTWVWMVPARMVLAWWFRLLQFLLAAMTC